MITCPLCEHVQAGGPECRVCGHVLPESLLAAAGVPLPRPEPLAGLEPTAIAAPVPPRPAPAADAPCRFCGHVQAAGALCDRCGRQRHRGVGQPPSPGLPPAPRCRQCGLPTAPPRCRNCGERVPDDA